ncbi:MAG TPA: glycosyltransferase family 4 protein [bacterium]|nr:glycosyltransferase family 4 protein [bacterium]
MPPDRPVLFLVGPFPPPLGGMERVIGDLFTSPVAKAVRFHKFSTHGPPSITWSKVGKQLYLRQLLGKLERAIASERPALLHLHAAWGAAFWRTEPITYLAARHQVPVLLHLQSGRMHEFFGNQSPEGQERARRYLDHCTGIAVLSPGWVTTLRNWAPAKPWFVIPNCVNVETFACPERVAKRPGEKFRWVFAGRLETAKGILEMLPHFPADGGRELHLCGRATEPAIRAALEEVRGNPAVIQHGEVALEAMRGPYCQAHGFLFPTYYEGLPLAMVEAMAAGLVVVSTPVGAIPEVLEGIPGNRLIPPREAVAVGEAIAAVEADPQAALHTGEANRQRAVEQYSIAALTEATLAAYRSLGVPC